MTASGLAGVIEGLEGFHGKIVLLTHIKADLDALGSAIALKRYLAVLAPESTVSITVPGGPSAHGKRLLDAFSETTCTALEREVDYVFLLDTPTLDQISPLGLGEVKGKVVVVDHHAPHSDTRSIADFYIVDEAASSTAEVLYPFLKELVREDRTAALALLCGIMADSARLRYAGNATIHVLSDLLKTSGLDMNDASGFLEVPDDISRRIAHLKAAQRMKLHRSGDWVIATSRVKAFGSSAAMQLLYLGADCALVASHDGEERRIHARAKPGFVKETGINLGADIMPEIGRLLGGSGGGHAGAAGARGREGDLKKALEEAVRMVEERIGER
jgi:nanoRNase/pAp phosphatase (c-di-AMP/oligoRNAs hydrolase)